MPVVAAPDLERTFDTAHGMLAVVVFLVPGIISFALDPVLFLLADRYPRRWFLRGGVAGMAVASFACALAPNTIVLAIAIGVCNVANGIAASLAQATLVDRTPEARGQTLARWTLCSAIGDLAAPALLGGAALLGLGWRTAYAAVGVLLVVWFILLRVDEVSPHDDEEAAPLLQSLREALRDKALVAWLFATMLCDLLDEILVVFASLHVRQDLGASAAWQSAIVAAFIAGDIVGLVILERLLRRGRAERTLLVAGCIGCAITYAAWLSAPTVALALLLAVPAGVCIAPLYPLAAAQAYACRPDASGSVLAAGHLFTPLGLALPWLVGTVADHAGVPIALLLLVVQPVGIVVIALATRRGR